MSEIVTYDEARQLAEIDDSNPLSTFIKTALLPNQGSGNNLTELVSGQSFTVSENLNWLPDGFVTAVSSASAEILNDVPFDLTKDDILFFASLKQSVGAGNLKTAFIHFKPDSKYDGEELTIEQRDYNRGYRARVRGDGYATQIQIQKGSDDYEDSLVFHYDNVNNVTKIYINGALTHTSSAIDLADNSSKNYNVHLAINQFIGVRAIMLLTKTGSFSQSEVESIALNPYQLFKTEIEAVPEDYSGSANIVVSNSFVNEGSKSSSSSSSFYSTNEVVATGSKVSIGSALATATHDATNHGVKGAMSAAEIETMYEASSSGVKAAYGEADSVAYVSFNISGTSAELIERSGSANIVVVSETRSSGKKEGVSAAEFTLLAFIECNGIKSAEGTSDTASFAEFSIDGLKQTGGISGVAVYTSFNFRGISDSFLPFIGQLVIPCHIENTLTLSANITNKTIIIGEI